MALARRFNPPPNWPAAPAGWTPPPGWQPDPAWGPPPPDWPVWVSYRAGPVTGLIARSRPVRWGVWLYPLIVFGIALLVSVVSNLGRASGG